MKDTLIVKTAKTKNGKTFWIPVGRAFVNKKPDGSIEHIGIALDAFPLNGALRAWPYEPHEKKDSTNHVPA